MDRESVEWVIEWVETHLEDSFYFRKIGPTYGGGTLLLLIQISSNYGC